MRQKMKQWLGALLSIALMLGLMPGMSLTAYADDDPYASLVNTTKEITFDGKAWYLIAYDSSTVTLLSKECVASSKYNESGSFVEYSNNPTVKTAVDNWYRDNITADAKTAVSGDAMFLLTKDQADATSAAVRRCSQADGADTNYWWLCSPSPDADECAACVWGDIGYVYVSGHGVWSTLGVRPALKLDLSKVEFNSETNTFALPAPSAYADYLPAATDDATALAAKVVKFNGHDWYLIEDNSTSATEGTVTLFAADTSFGATQFNSSDNVNKYSTSTVKTYLDGMTETGGAFADVADAIETVTLTTDKDTDVTAKLYLLSKLEAEALPANVLMIENFANADYNGSDYWLRSPKPNNGMDAAYVNTSEGTIGNGLQVYHTFGVRPALQLDLSKVTFDSESKTFSVTGGNVDVTGVSLDPSTAQTISVDGTVSFTAIVSPDDATDKTVKWSVGGTNTDAVKLYSDQSCTTEVGTDATETLTVYAKGISAGNATVTATSNADSSKNASCEVTVNALVTNKGADPAPVVGTVEVHRTYNPKSGEHFYTASAEERDAIVALGWVDEGVGWVAPETSSTPVFRLYSGTDHHFTASAEERDKLVALGWVDEGVACYSDDEQGTPLYRLFNPNVDPHAANNNSGSHHFTTNKAEYDYLASLGWVNEGVAWHGVAQ